MALDCLVWDREIRLSGGSCSDTFYSFLDPRSICMVETALLLLVLFTVISLFTRAEAIRLANTQGVTPKLKLRHYARALTIVLGHTILFVFLIPWAVGKWLRDRGKKR